MKNTMVAPSRPEFSWEPPMQSQIEEWRTWLQHHLNDVIHVTLQETAKVAPAPLLLGVPEEYKPAKYYKAIQQTIRIGEQFRASGPKLGDTTVNFRVGESRVLVDYNPIHLLQ